MKKLIVKALVLSISTVCLAACAEVQPWQRGNLAKPVMQGEVSPAVSSMRQHNYASREAAGAASNGASGGGCGCN